MSKRSSTGTIVQFSHGQQQQQLQQLQHEQCHEPLLASLGPLHADFFANSGTAGLPFGSHEQLHEPSPPFSSSPSSALSNAAMSNGDIHNALTCSSNSTNSRNTSSRKRNNNDNNNDTPMSPLLSCLSPLTRTCRIQTNNTVAGGWSTGTNRISPWSKSHQSNDHTNSDKHTSSAISDNLIEATEKMIANDMASLTINERQRAYEELHGVASMIDETAELIAQQFKGFHKEVDKIFRAEPTNATKTEYERCIFLRPSWTYELKLSFLRAEGFVDAKEAATRFVQHLQMKSLLFGSDYLLKDITYQDLDNDSRQSLCAGSHQTFADRVGRNVTCVFPNSIIYKSIHNLFRAIWYQLMTLLRDKNAQRKGLVFCVCVGTNTPQTANAADPNFINPMFDIQMHKMANKVYTSIPLKVAAFHFCYSDIRIIPAMSLLHLTIGDRGRVRFRSHFGTPMETQYELMTFGFPPEAWPVDSQGNVQVERLLNDIQTQHEKEQMGATQAERHKSSSPDYRQQQQKPVNNQNGDSANISSPTSSTNAIDVPTDLDVLFGKGKPYQEYPGNQQLQHIVGQYSTIYQGLQTRIEKTNLIKQVVQVIHESGGRFLKRAADEKDQQATRENARGGTSSNSKAKQRSSRLQACASDGWVQVEAAQAREKVSHCFRNFRHLQNNNAKA